MRHYCATLLLRTLLASAALSAGAPAAWGASIPSDDVIAQARIYFRSQRYEEAVAALDKAIAANAPVTAELRFMRARSLFATGNNNADSLATCRTMLAELIPDGGDLEYRRLAALWAGRASLRRAELLTGREAVTAELREADRYFTLVTSTNGIDDEDFDARYFDSVTWGRLAELEPDGTESNYGRALSQLEELLRVYPQREMRDMAMLYTIIFQVRLHRHETALTTCEQFFHDYPESRHLLRVRAYKAECLYYSDRLDDAAAEYQAVLQTAADTDVQQMARYGLGWSYIRLATNADQETRRKHLRLSCASFRQFIASAPPDDRRLQTARFKMAEALVEVGEFGEALELLERLQEPPYAVRSAAYAGQAAYGLGRFEDASRHFLACLQTAANLKMPPMQLTALQNLARSELAAGQPALACIHYRQSAQLAQSMRDLSAIAQGQLGMVISLLELGIAKGAGREAPATTFLADALAVCAGAPFATTGPSSLRRRLHDRASADQLRALSAVDTLRLARGQMDAVLARQRERLRPDEVEYQHGRILAELGRQLSETHRAGAPASFADEAATQKILTVFEDGEKAFDAALSSNPHGDFSARTLFAHGKLLYDAGLLTQHIAEVARQFEEEYRARNTVPPVSMTTYLEYSQKYLTRAGEHFHQANRMAAEGALAHQSLYMLALVYTLLDRFDDAERSFRELLGTQGIDVTLRIMTARQLALAIKKMDRPGDALQVLAPFRDIDRASALQAGYLALELNDPVQAVAYFTPGNLPAAASATDVEADAELRYNRFTAMLRRAALPQTSAAAKKRLQDDAAKGLARTALDYPASPWGWKSAIRLATHYRESKQPSLALAVIAEGLARLQSAEGHQELLLLRGGVLSDMGDHAAAQDAFREALLVEQSGPQARRLRARALIELARSYRRLNNPREALASYGRVYATYPGETTEADRARFEAAAYLRELGRAQEALPILRAANDANEARLLIREIQKDAAAAGSHEEALLFR